jgi:hypothetical protein
LALLFVAGFTVMIVHFNAGLPNARAQDRALVFLLGPHARALE